MVKELTILRKCGKTCENEISFKIVSNGWMVGGVSSFCTYSFAIPVSYLVLFTRRFSFKDISVIIFFNYL